MIGILVITHEDLGDHLIRCARHVMGDKPKQLQYLSIFIQDDPDIVLSNGQALIKQLDDGDGVLVLSDIYGATPCNIASKLIQPGKVECISGVNLPMLVRTLTYRNESLSTVVEKALGGGRDGVQHIRMESSHAA
jgi:mannose PTS system EIIA component